MGQFLLLVKMNSNVAFAIITVGSPADKFGNIEMKHQADEHLSKKL